MGIDMGTSSAKGVALNGTSVSASTRIALSPPATTSDLWNAFEEAFSDLLPPERRSEVDCLCVGGRAPTLVGIRADDQPGPVFGWIGDREGGREDVFHMDAVAKRLIEHDRNLHDSCRFYVNPHEYLSFRLTGIVRSSSPSDLYHPWGGYVTEAARRIRKARIDPAKVAPPMLVGRPIGNVSTPSARALGLKNSAMVVMGGWDFMMDLLGSGLNSAGKVLIRGGTSLALDLLWSNALTLSGFHSTPHFMPGLFVVGKLIRPPLLQPAYRPDSQAAGRARPKRAVEEVAEDLLLLNSAAGEPSSVVCSGPNAMSLDFCSELAVRLGRDVERVTTPVTEAHGAAIVASVAVGLTPTYEDHIRVIESGRERVTTV